MTLRIPDELGERIKALAAKDRRSVNNYIISVLEYAARTQFLIGVHEALLQGRETDLGRMVKNAVLNGEPPTVRVVGKVPLDAQGIPVDATKGKASLGVQNPICTCGPGERAKGKHNKWCPMRGK